MTFLEKIEQISNQIKGLQDQLVGVRREESKKIPCSCATTLIDKLKVEDDKLNQELDDPRGGPRPNGCSPCLEC